MNLNDQLRSVYRMLWELFSAERAAGMRLELQRVQRLQRPQMRLENTAFREIDLGSGIYRDDCQFAITYFGTNRDDTFNVVAKLESYVVNGGLDYSLHHLIQGWRFGWNFPQPFVKARAGGDIEAGDHAVRVSGIDVCGNESAASLALVVTTEKDSVLHIRIPRVTWNHPLFPHYKVYIDGFQEAAVDMPRWGYPEVTITTLLGTGSAPLEIVGSNGAQRAVRWRWLRIDRLSSVIREDAIEAGHFQATVTLETSAVQPRGMPQTETIQTITVAEEIVQGAQANLGEIITTTTIEV